MASGRDQTDEDDLLAQLGDLGVHSVSSFSSPTSVSAPGSTLSAELVNDPLADLENLAKADSPIPVRAGTPRRSAEGGLAAATSGAIPVDSSQSTATAQLPTTAPQAASSDGQASWWGGLVATVSTIEKRAMAAVADIQQSDEAKRLTEQVKGNVGAFQGLRTGLTSRVMPAVASILDSIAPVMQHELVQVHVSHDMAGFPSVDQTILDAFRRVIVQVDGGEVSVDSAGTPQAGLGHRRRPSEWADGPWWRQNDIPATAVDRNFNIVDGMTEGRKLAIATASNSATRFFATPGFSLDDARKAVFDPSPDTPKSSRASHVFIAIQPTGNPFADPTGDAGEAGEADGQVCFAVCLTDAVHSIVFTTLSQPFPRRWADWLQHSPVKDGSSEPVYPADIEPMIADSGLDPRSWAADWVESSLSLAVGVLAQRYVARRMGVGLASPDGRPAADKSNGRREGKETAGAV